MAGTSFSLTEKLAATGAFLALVALAVGTEDDPGVVATGRDTMADLRVVAASTKAAAAPAPEQLPIPDAGTPPSVSEAEPSQEAILPTSLAPLPPTGSGNPEGRYDPELGRVPLDFSKGPPGS